MAGYDSGVLFLRPTAETTAFVAEWIAGSMAGVSVRDRDVFTALARTKYGPNVDNDTNLFWAFHGSLKLGVMPVSLFCNGHTYFLQVISVLSLIGSFMYQILQNLFSGIDISLLSFWAASAEIA